MAHGPELAIDPLLRTNWRRVQAFLRRDGAGLAASAGLHLLAVLLLLYLIHGQSQVARTITRVLSVDIVNLGRETESAAADRKSPVARQSSPPRGQPSSLVPAGASRDEKKPLPEDAFDAKLHALAQLRQSDARLQPLDNDGSDADSTGDAGAHATYSLRDFVRAQVLRHWNLDYSILGDRRFSVRIRVAMTGRGVIVSSEIVDRTRYSTDPIYREIALSARNAVTLSSPIPLPPGTYQKVTMFVLDLDPRDTNR